MDLRRYGSARRTALWAALTALMLGACSLYSWTPVAKLPDGTQISRVNSMLSRAAPPNPSLGTLAPLQVESSLRRITVRYAKLIGSNDPTPLFSERQASLLASVLARELPTLGAKERLHISGHDPYRGGSLEMDAYQEGNYLVYYFGSLGDTEGMGSLNPSTPIFLVSFVSMPGQKLRANPQFAEVKDPLVGDLKQQDEDLRIKVGLLKAAMQDAVITGAEEDELEELARARPQDSVDVWRSYLEKLRTLKRAHEQGLMDDEAYKSQLKRINEEIKR